MKTDVWRSVLAADAVFPAETERTGPGASVCSAGAAGLAFHREAFVCFPGAIVTSSSPSSRRPPPPPPRSRKLVRPRLKAPERPTLSRRRTKAASGVRDAPARCHTDTWRLFPVRKLGERGGRGGNVHWANVFAPSHVSLRQRQLQTWQMRGRWGDSELQVDRLHARLSVKRLALRMRSHFPAQYILGGLLAPTLPP